MAGMVRIGIAGTSWWADSMYLPALESHPLAAVRAVAGTRPAHSREFAARWGIPTSYDTAEAMLDAEPLDAVIVATPNRSHFPIAQAALERGLHVLCEKPVAMSSSEARRLADLAAAKGATTMVPFTYANMPGMRYLKELVDQGYLGQPYHLNMRYFAGYGRNGEYAWRFDLDVAGAALAGDLGSHLAYYAYWLFGEVESVTAEFGQNVVRANRPDGSDYPRGEDSAIILLRFASGATGNLHVSSLAHEPSAFDQLQAVELHGSAGTLHYVNDWNRLQVVSGARADERAVDELPIPDHCWGGAPRDLVRETYKHVFRHQETQARAFVSAVAAGRPVKPDLADGLHIQRIVDAAVLSAREGRRVPIAEIAASER
jgi:predicted dehydrogenase